MTAPDLFVKLKPLATFPPQRSYLNNNLSVFAGFPPDPFRLRNKLKGVAVQFIVNKETREFIAKYFGDLSKAILTVGFASYFFEKLPIFLRFGFIAAALVLFLVSVIILEKGGQK